MNEIIIGTMAGLCIALAIVFFICWTIDRPKKDKQKWSERDILQLISNIISARDISKVDAWIHEDLRDDLQKFILNTVNNNKKK